jgi:predicted RNA-binding protein with PIN domain
MSYLIDGHNLIPKLGLDLKDPDDEIRLIERLQFFCRLKQTDLEIYFDGANPGQPASSKFGRVTAHFVRMGNSADAAIESRLMKLGRAARNWNVVSSDHRVQGAAHAVHARVISSDDFARQVMQATTGRSIQAKKDASLSPQEVEDWLDFFKNGKKN